ncbi:MAG: ATP synthase F1 subunit epsilon [Coriobacteriaceae bacterium]|jgi:F-type H+-transporting ATPase subunit epsilon|nr:ATP synthase F1 subunit epsilon [Coriobacteriaceae bacterium]
MSSLVCDIVTPAEKLYSQEAYMVTVPGIEGSMGYLQGHEPLVSVLSDGIARIQPSSDAEVQRFVLQGGYVEVTGEKVIILADRACPVEAVDAEAVAVKLAALEADLAASSGDAAERALLATDIAWCKAQMGALA